MNTGRVIGGLLGILIPASTGAVVLEVELDGSRRFDAGHGARAVQRIEIEWTQDTWRGRLGQPPGDGLPEVTLSGPSPPVVSHWVAGRCALRAGLGLAGFRSVGSGHPGPRVVPDVRGPLLGAAAALGRGRLRATVALGLVTRDDREPARPEHPRLALLGVATTPATGRRRAALRSHAWAVLLGARSDTGPTVAAFMSTRGPVTELRADGVWQATGGPAWRLSARGQGVLGETRLTLEIEPSSPPNLFDGASGTRHPPRRHLQIALRAPAHGLELTATAQVPASPTEGVRVRRVTSLAGVEVISAVRLSREGVLVSQRLVTRSSSLGVSRASGEAAWLLGIRCPLRRHLVVEVETRGWRGASTRTAAALGSTAGVGTRRLGAAGRQGNLAVLRLGWQGRPVRVRLAVAAREARGRQPARLLSGELRWSTGS